MNTVTLLAQAGLVGAVGHWAIIAVVVAAIVGCLYVGLRQAGVAIPPFVVTLFWICVCALIAVVAIKFLMGMA